ncbi:MULTISPECIES: ABC transporter ATP-binding protein [Bosea]|jgi:branched-chain amino acid transport system ATP-binding protein|uniref:ABC transporter ATP-binding protein n=1 Tax=Bosea rubneri TaxID=3075434 RepID=A0ABU3S0Z2_9HYPH|nr:MULTISPECIES: ABC transporter ATP-binding protein [unclassified Bosea (in: a-proteobacteria)]MDU0338459.1 ABC transporter ATP-binding protein [Bosea sp. ZW T0_25]HEV7336678.1 ABC transporter ATP-binding protein [Bosea sp. (in: a-proteobacteria)]
MLEVAKLHYAYAGAVAVSDVSLTVAEGEIVALLGANGAGKSTTVRMIAGALQPQGGSIRFEGQDVTRAECHEMVPRGVALCPEGRLIMPQMSVLENLLMGGYTQRDPVRRREAIEEMFALFPRLAERRNQLGGLMSGGEQQMLAIARALMSKPRLLILDEPSLGLAPKLVAEMFQLLKRVNETGTAILLVEQNARQALRVSHRAYVLEKGQTVREDRSSNLIDDDAIRAAFLGI